MNCVCIVDEVGKFVKFENGERGSESNSQSWLELEEVTVVITKCLGFSLQ